MLFDESTIDYAFAKTRTVVRLFVIGVRFVSRSEAKRLLHGLDRFREVVLDFRGVEGVGRDSRMRFSGSGPRLTPQSHSSR